jgi:hypothetical protein
MYRAKGIVSSPFQCYIVHDNELVIHRIIICNNLVLSFEPKYL